jgi:hypothetical protein
MLEDDEYKVRLRDRDFTGSRLGNVAAPLQSERMSSDHPRQGSTAEHASKAAAAAGIAVAGPHVAARNERVGSNNVIYRNPQARGNQHYKIVGESRNLKTLGAISRGLIGAGQVADTIEYKNGNISTLHFGANTAANGAALFLGPPGEIGAAAYYGLQGALDVSSRTMQMMDEESLHTCDSCVDPE